MEYFICAVSRSNVIQQRYRYAIEEAVRQQLNNSWVKVTVDELGYVMSDYPLKKIDTDKVIKAVKGVVGNNNFFAGVLGSHKSNCSEVQTQEKLFINKRVVAVVDPTRHTLGFGTIKDLEPNKYKRLRFIIELDDTSFFKKGAAMYSDEVIIFSIPEQDIDMLSLRERYMRNQRSLNFEI